MSVEELHPEKNSIWNRWKATAVEWLAVIISGFAALITVVWGGLAIIVVSYQAGTIQQQNARIDKLEALVEKEISMKSNRTIRLETWLKSKGVPIEEIYDDVPR